MKECPGDVLKKANGKTVSCLFIYKMPSGRLTGVDFFPMKSFEGPKAVIVLRPGKNPDVFDQNEYRHLEEHSCKLAVCFLHYDGTISYTV
eukprot:m.107546 g.107546  ORF g.107546 m.107546 type:complete len:90 (+) comp37303_c0_seq7:4818-5087(+)